MCLAFSHLCKPVPSNIPIVMYNFFSHYEKLLNYISKYLVNVHILSILILNYNTYSSFTTSLCKQKKKAPIIALHIFTYSWLEYMRLLLHSPHDKDALLSLACLFNTQPYRPIILMLYEITLCSIHKTDVEVMSDLPREKEDSAQRII